jgi:hypothetical protein
MLSNDFQNIKIREHVNKNKITCYLEIILIIINLKIQISRRELCYLVLRIFILNIPFTY